MEMKQSAEQNVIHTVPVVPPCRYTGTVHDDCGMFELNAYKRCESFVDLPMYTFPASTTDHSNNMFFGLRITLDRHGGG